ncbi:MAG TPA: hypothetical protein ENH67_12870 [Pseudoalteromonas sp.]|uniref:hypothetical protein n=1 Tax=Pseudoalteromonas sp. TaxID=53249 RepID=UPI00175E76A5|nr:hypothetical protein [Pseudoalteromonas sp.]HDY92736.1 hypothetical protein [Pseudoalteromonas sp.]HDZ33752.1 hypothetical protein [Pseudoalteromonas sp.]
MAGRFDPSGVLGQFNNMGIPEAPYIPPVPDKRSRTEIREDFEKVKKITVTPILKKITVTPILNFALF